MYHILEYRFRLSYGYGRNWNLSFCRLRLRP